MTGVLGGPRNNELHLPGQLIPFLVGAFSFIRTCHILIGSWRLPREEAEPLDSESGSPQSARTIHFRDLPLVFSPAMARNSIATSENTDDSDDNDETDNIESERNWPVRYIISWLPWLSLLPYFKDKPMTDKERRLSDDSEYWQEYEKVGSMQSPGEAQTLQKPRATGAR
jgi:hypothetical protein